MSHVHQTRHLAAPPPGPGGPGGGGRPRGRLSRRGVVDPALHPAQDPLGRLLLFVVSGLTFLIFYTFPSADPAALRAGRQATPELIAQIRRQLGLDQPVYVQYWRYMKGLVLHFDLGYSYQNNVSVRSQLFTRLPVTISLTIGAFVFWMLVAVPVGILSAVRRRSLLDRARWGSR